MFKLKKEKEEKVGESTFSKLWHNKRTHSAMVLGVYLVFIMGVVILINLIPPNNSDSDKTQDITIEVMKENLIAADFSFEYDIHITRDDEEIFKVNYKGNKKGSETIGYKELSDSIIKYKISDDVVYNLLLDNEPEIEDFYENINPNYLDLNYIFTVLRPRNYDVLKYDDILKYTYEDVSLGSGNIVVNIVIYTNQQEITQINIIKKELFQKGFDMGNDDFYTTQEEYVLKYRELSWGN